MSKILAYKAIAGIFLALAVANPAGAGSHSPQAMIEALLALEGEAYLDARDALLAGETEPVTLAQQVRGWVHGAQSRGATSQTDWLVLAFADALAMHAAHPQEASRLLNLDGLDSEVYNLRRNPAPSALGELQNLRHVAPLMMELYLKGLDGYLWLNNVTDTELEVLKAELLTVIGDSGHESSAAFLATAVEDRTRVSDAVFGAAVSALGSTDDRQALAVLLKIIDDARRDGDIELVALAVEALGGIHQFETWPHLRAELSHNDPRVRAAAIRGARAYGSRWHWADDPAQGDAMRQEIGLLLVDILTESDDRRIVDAVMASLGSLATPGLRESLWSASALLDGMAGASGKATERLKRALSLVNRSLSRR